MACIDTIPAVVLQLQQQQQQQLALGTGVIAR
jgi:hypothetical protein